MKKNPPEPTVQSALDRLPFSALTVLLTSDAPIVKREKEIEKRSIYARGTSGIQCYLSCLFPFFPSLLLPISVSIPVRRPAQLSSTSLPKEKQKQVQPA
jgi:hypothetical protein